LVAQETSKEGAIFKFKEAIESFQIVYQYEEKIYNSPIAIKDIHDFLTVEGKEPTSEVFELRAVYVYKIFFLLLCYYLAFRI
jgi:hypothetical protein